MTKTPKQAPVVATRAVRASTGSTYGGSAGACTMEDVAHEAGVALVTVSRVINEPDKVSEKTLKTVRAAIDKLRYVPNLTAGSLASNRSRIVAAVVPTLSNALFAETVDGLAETLSNGGYQLLLGQTFYRAEDETKVVQAFLGRRVDGIVLTGTTHAPGLRSTLKRAGIPVVETWDMGRQPIDMLVGFSHRQAGREAAAYLIGKGYRSLAVVGSYPERSLMRVEGFVEAAAELGIVDVEIEYVDAPSSVDDGARSLLSLLARKPAIDAIFCASDMVALGALLECQRRGWSVPGRVALMGFADLPVAGAGAAGISTVQVPRHQIGVRAGEMLLARFADRPLAQRIQDLGVKVVARATA